MAYHCLPMPAPSPLNPWASSPLALRNLVVAHQDLTRIAHYSPIELSIEYNMDHTWTDPSKDLIRLSSTPSQELSFENSHSMVCHTIFIIKAIVSPPYDCYLEGIMGQQGNKSFQNVWRSRLLKFGHLFSFPASSCQLCIQGDTEDERDVYSL